MSMKPRVTFLWVALLSGWFTGSALRAEEIVGSCLTGTCLESCNLDSCCSNPACSYGPCQCVPRKTLLQWSYGTSFTGGPDLTEPLSTDRPDFIESPSTVGRGVLQLEMGYTYAYDDDGPAQLIEQSWPEALLRVGILAEWLELRLFWTMQQESLAGNTTVGASDLGVGLKFALTPQECLLPEMGLIVEMGVPVGSAAFTANEVQPAGIWIYAWDLNDWLSTAGQTSFGRALDDTTNEPYLEIAQAWGLAAGLTDRVGAYAEWVGIIPNGADTERTVHRADGGFTYLVNDDLQWDVFAGVGLNDAAEDYFLGTGISFRYY